MHISPVGSPTRLRHRFCPQRPPSRMVPSSKQETHWASALHPLPPSTLRRPAPSTAHCPLPGCFVQQDAEVCTALRGGARAGRILSGESDAAVGQAAGPERTPGNRISSVSSEGRATARGPASCPPATEGTTSGRGSHGPRVLLVLQQPGQEGGLLCPRPQNVHVSAKCVCEGPNGATVWGDRRGSRARAGRAHAALAMLGGWWISGVVAPRDLGGGSKGSPPGGVWKGGRRTRTCLCHTNGQLSDTQ